jgi:hypothetical protein
MTFTEAAIEVLRREGKPLHFRKLAEIAVRENLLDHVGKVPEETMAGQLAAHCRLPKTERRVIAVQPGTFALVEWGIDEDPTGLDGLVEAPPEDELPYRSRERHPVPSRDLARSSGRTEARPRRREDEERRGRRFPPPAEVAYEILAGAGKPLGLAEIAATGAERLLMPDAFVRDVAALRAALEEDNGRREASGRKALFELEGDAVTLVAQPEPGERVAPAAPRVAAGAGDLRRAALATLRGRLRACDEPTVEHVAMRLLEKLGFKDLKVAKRGREHVVCTGKRKMGLVDVRHAIRILRGGADAGRRDVTDLRRDIGHYGAQIGIVITPGEAARDARGDAGAAGQLPVMLLCGEALAEAFADAGVGCVPVIVPEVDEAFFRTAAEVAERDEVARKARRDERDRREGREPREPREPRELREPREPRPPREPREPRAADGDRVAPEDGQGRVIAEVPADGDEGAALAGGPAAEDVDLAAREADVAIAAAVPAEAEDEGEDEGEEGDDEGPEGEAAEGAEAGSAAAPGEAPGQGDRRRRRRRRRRRGGRGRGSREGAPGAPGAAEAGAAAAGPAAEGGSAPASAAPEPAPQPQPPPLPPREPPAGEGA